MYVTQVILGHSVRPTPGPANSAVYTCIWLYCESLGRASRSLSAACCSIVLHDSCSSLRRLQIRLHLLKFSKSDVCCVARLLGYMQILRHLCVTWLRHGLHDAQQRPNHARHIRNCLASVDTVPRTTAVLYLFSQFAAFLRCLWPSCLSRSRRQSVLLASWPSGLLILSNAADVVARWYLVQYLTDRRKGCTQQNGQCQ